MIRALAIAVMVFAAAGARAAPPSFEYDATKPMPPATLGEATTPAPGVTAQSVIFSSEERRITGELIQGAGAGPHPAVLFVHWLGERSTTNHTEFEADALALAKTGVTSLLIDAPWSQRGWFGALGADADADLRASANTVIDLRRSLDLLLRQPGVDANRLAFVGHDFGAMFGMLMASVDHRPSWYVLMAPNSSIGEWYLWQKDKPDRAAYMARLAAIDVPAFLKLATAKGMLLQFSAHDEYITAANAQAIVEAAALPRGVFTYDVDHSLGVPAAHEDRVAWLKSKLLAAP